MKIVTYNLRVDLTGDGVNSFTNRKGHVIDKIETEMPDVIGFQEVTPSMLAYLSRKLTDYTIIGCGRAHDYLGEHNPVAFNKNKYELIHLDMTWLSDTPYVPGSRFEIQSRWPRIITHTILRPIGEGEPFHMYNTHLDHVSSEARQKGAARLIEKIEEDQRTHPFPLLITGDFNALPESGEIKMLSERFINLTSGVGVTFHDFGCGALGQIDYIFTEGFCAVSEPVKWTEEWNRVFLSDHYPVQIDVERKDGGLL